MTSLVTKTISWIKSNKLSAFLIVVLLSFILRPQSIMRDVMYRSLTGATSMDLATGGGFSSASVKSMPAMYAEEYAPQPDVSNRMVITESNLSLLVKNVEDTAQQIKDYVLTLKGYVVQTSITKPEFGANGYLVIRIPAAKLDETLAYLKEKAVKVVSENISGTDITDQYEDISEKLRQLESTKKRFEQIMAQAQDVAEILKVQREILNLQSQIDSLKGRQAYLDGASATTLITINLSTDELGLPYAPEKSWRPEVIFKQATRSLIYTMQDLGSAAIWVAVYAPVILIGIVILLIVKKALAKKS